MKKISIQISIQFIFAILLFANNVKIIENYTIICENNLKISADADGILVCSASNDQKDFQIISDGAGGVILVWEDYRNGAQPDIYARRVSAKGISLWDANGVVICNAINNQLKPQIISDKAGGAIIAWNDYRSANAEIYAQRIDADGNILWGDNGTLIITGANSRGGVRLISDDAGGAILTWYDYRNGVSDANIYAHKINSSGGDEWAANGVVICNIGLSQYEPNLVSDGAGGAIIAWQDPRTGGVYDIYAQRVESNGDVNWTTNGMVICNAGQQQYTPEMISDGLGGAIMVWSDRRNTNEDLFAQRVNSTGSINWTANGLAICTAIGAQWQQKIISDGAGGVIIVWQDGRNFGSNKYDIYAQHVNITGAISLSADGDLISDAALQQQRPQIVSDGAGGAFIFWDDNRTAPPQDYNIYGQYLKKTSSFTQMWTNDGIPIIATTYQQLYPKAISDGSGKSIIVWNHNVNTFTNYDIYTQLVDCNGDILWPVDDDGEKEDDDDDDDEEFAIPFGNFYIFFIAISLIALIVITKKKNKF